MTTWQEETPAGIVLAHTTTRDEGDFAVGGEPRALAERRRRVVDRPWVWLRQVHGARVVVATQQNAADLAGTEADAVVTTEADLALAVQTADCVPLVFWSENGVIAAAHAGWRGFEAGVVARTVGTMRSLGAERIRGRSGPHIEGACYEFGAADLDRLAERFGDRVRTTTRDGRAALDLAELARASTDALGLAGWTADGSCTACGASQWFSHRARADAGRMATVVWRSAGGAAGSAG